jgi:hypothetical protein
MHVFERLSSKDKLMIPGAMLSGEQEGRFSIDLDLHEP